VGAAAVGWREAAGVVWSVDDSTNIGGVFLFV
jgi:hypothetical protein